MGAITFVALNQFDVSQSFCAVAGGAVVIHTRAISIKYDLHLPKFTKSREV